MTKFRWGVFGTGAISTKFLAGLAQAKNAEASFIASRSLKSAQRFADGVGVARAIEGYTAAVQDADVDAIYIATPPSEHAKHALLCIEAGIPVLVEKPFALNAEEARRVADAARANSVFAMEAMWTRFLPAAQALRERVASEELGDIRFVTGNFGISVAPDIENTMYDSNLGQGALSHLAPYPLSLSQWLFGAPVDVQAVGRIGETGVVEDAAVHATFSNGVIGSFFVSMRAWAPDHFQVLGAQGMLSLRGSVVRPYGVDVSSQSPVGYERPRFDFRERFRQNGFVHFLAQRLGKSSRSGSTADFHYYRGNGYHYEMDEVRDCVMRGETESQIMPLDDSVAVAAFLDEVLLAVKSDRHKEIDAV
ncbi:MAG: Gfo/Idh/MocA family oxidoreductase [Pseudomonadota bacterium]